MDNSEIIKTLHGFVAAQTVAIETFEHSQEFITEVFKSSLSTKYRGRFVGNRQQKKAVNNLYDEELKTFSVVIKKYIQTNRKMLKHFDSWNNEESQKNVDKVYNALD